VSQQTGAKYRNRVKDGAQNPNGAKIGRFLSFFGDLMSFSTF
jgi:hypothetical protein